MPQLMLLLALHLEGTRCFPSSPAPFNGPLMHAQNTRHLGHTERPLNREIPGMREACYQFHHTKVCGSAHRCPSAPCDTLIQHHASEEHSR